MIEPSIHDTALLYMQSHRQHHASDEDAVALGIVTALIEHGIITTIPTELLDHVRQGDLFTQVLEEWKALPEGFEFRFFEDMGLVKFKKKPVGGFVSAEETAKTARMLSGIFGGTIIPNPSYYYQHQLRIPVSRIPFEPIVPISEDNTDE